MGEHPTPRISIGARQATQEILCYVQDNGIGIDPRYHEKIYRDIRMAYQRHANSYLVKPTDFGAFARLMDDLRRHWLRYNHVPLLGKRP